MTLNINDKIAIVIPARMGSTRFWGKPLALINKKPMVQWVYEVASTIRRADFVMVATDSLEIKQAVENFGGHALLTRADHASGTDRIIEAMGSLPSDIGLIINIQGDEPNIHPETINGVIDLFENPQCEIATSAIEFSNLNDVENPDNVKVVVTSKNMALYFSRSPIPYYRDHAASAMRPLKHQGLYAYRKAALERIGKLSVCPLENIEKLEQLRFLDDGMKIYVYKSSYESIGVDRPEDIEKLEKLLSNKV